ncbi:GTPase Era [Entomospira culicis]|uniref:GTPase Era n=1 Tax=Entomospira culicis TaxID=2719989 RepID=A0A968KW61_9SPIO|nr:GTPase Era [Entomospira culicis]NIZ18627.1 GTPase Era [Entomospira culicis]NIZ68842.1 GTPase Era [Entomospira culicis]WDI37436.1 GTPase Era [Entomospira culicis]WDI39064.1 GTPase Era [Entomospira culicis]
MDSFTPQAKHVGFIALIGRPSTGKSTFINRVVGHNLAIVAALPQSTRQRVRGILNTTDAQLIFTDTPGIHSSEKRFNRHLLNQAKLGMEEADVILYLVDVTRKIAEEEMAIATLLKSVSQPVVIALNKTDKAKNFTVDYMLFFNKLFPNKEIFKISAKENMGIHPLLHHLTSLLPVGPMLYPEDIYTDQEPSLRIAEILRKHAILSLKEEIPHALYVKIEDLQMKGARLWVRVALVVERESQKPILIGKGASNLRKIRIASLKELSTVFPYKIDLDIQIKVDKDWRSNEHRLSQILTP